MEKIEKFIIDVKDSEMENYVKINLVELIEFTLEDLS